MVRCVNGVDVGVRDSPLLVTPEDTRGIFLTCPPRYRKVTLPIHELISYKNPPSLSIVSIPSQTLLFQKKISNFRYNFKSTPKFISIKKKP